LAVSRRRFLHHGVLAAAACAASPLLALGPKRPVGGNEDTLLRQPSTGSDSWQDHALALDGMTREQFAGAVGSDFKVSFSDGITSPVWARLMTVGDLPAPALVNPASFAVANRQSGTAPATSGYLLTFGSSAEIQQGTYLFEHGTLGRFALFVVPDGPQAYTAVINRLSAPTIIAMPFQTGGSVPVMVSPATSSAIENPSAQLSGSQGVRRGGLRD
jgi:hypothetical protein